MATAIIIIVALGILDVMLFLACFELEKRYEIWEEEHERSNSKADK